MKSCRVKKLIRLSLVCAALVLCFGCGRCQEDLENAKQQIGSLNAEIQRLTETSAALDKERGGLREELRLLTDKSAGLQKDVADLKKAKESLDAENGKLKTSRRELQEELNALKIKYADLDRETQTLKKHLAELEPAGQLSQVRPAEAASPSSSGPSASSPAKSLTPCDAVIEFMKRSGEIVRRHKGDERKKLLDQVKKELAPRMKGAPTQAVKSAHAWVNELSTSWDKPGEKTVYNLLTNRNAALDACGKTPDEAGF